MHGPSTNVISPFCQRRRAARWALKRDDVTSGRATLREDFSAFYTVITPVFRFHQGAESPCLQARNAGASWRVAV